MRVIVAGSRSFSDYELLKSKLDKILSQSKDITVISGGANGADKLGEQYAKERGYQLEVYLADWQAHGKKAGYLRNEQMAETATHCVCFHDGHSRGTGHMIAIAKRKGLPLRVVIFAQSN